MTDACYYLVHNFPTFGEGGKLRLEPREFLSWLLLWAIVCGNRTYDDHRIRENYDYGPPACWNIITHMKRTANYN